MCGFEPEDAPGIVEAELTPVVWTVGHVEALERAAEAAGRRIAVQVEVDTGMARQGVAPGPGLARLTEALGRAPHVRCEGVFSHLSSSEVVRSEQDAGAVHAVWVRARPDGAERHPGVRAPGQQFGGGRGLDDAVDAGRLTTKMSAAALVRPRRWRCMGMCVAFWKLRTTAMRRGFRRRRPGELGRRSAGGDVEDEGDRASGDWCGRHRGVWRDVCGERPMRVALLPVGYADGFRREASSGVGDGWVMIAGGGRLWWGGSR